MKHMDWPERRSMDLACKDLFSWPPLLAYIIQEAHVQMFEGLCKEDLLPCIEKDEATGTALRLSEEAGPFRLDLNLRLRHAKRLRFLNVEAQSKEPGYSLLRRGKEYGMALVIDQKEHQVPYGNECPAVSLWVTLQPSSGKEATIEHWTGAASVERDGKREPIEDDALVEVAVLRLGGKGSRGYHGGIQVLDEFFHGDEPLAKRIRNLEQAVGYDMPGWLKERTEEMLNLSKYYEDRGLEKGRQEGRQEGTTKAQIKSLKNLMDSLQVNDEKAMDLLKIPQEERDSLREALRSA